MYNDGLDSFQQRGWLRWVVGVPAVLVLAYAVVVLWYVATSPDLGFRALLADPVEEFGGVQTDGGIPLQESSGARVGVVLQQSPNPRSTHLPRRGDVLCEINRQRTRTFLDFSIRLAELREAPVPPGGHAVAGSDPSEMSRGHYPGIVEIDGGDRLVEIVFVRRGSAPAFDYVPQRALPASEITLTFVWFLLQLGVLIFGGIAFWNRPYDQSARLFCAMGTLSLGAFVGGFHWWIIAGNPWLNVPFLLCAGMLPSTTLHFFLVFPREKYPLSKWPVLSRLLLHGPPAVVTAGLVGVYLAAYWYNGVEASDAELATVVGLLATLRQGALFAIGMAAAYFAVTVVTLVLTFLQTRSPLERRLVRSILLAALVASVPMGYSLILAVEDRVGFAFGKARVPMFVASLVFMLAYANGMARHKLMLVDEIVGRSKLYYGVTVGVMVMFAIVISLASATIHVLSESLSGMQLFIGFAVLMMGVLLLLWLRDQFQHVIDRRFFSEKYQLDKALQRMNRAAGRLADPQSLGEMMLGTCVDAIQTESAAIYFTQTSGGELRLVAVRNYDQAPVEISDPDTLAALPDVPTRRVLSVTRETMSPVQAFMHDLHAELLYPLEGDNGAVGLVVLGRKQHAAAYTAEDLAFLRAIGQITTIALHSARTNQDLARLNDELRAKVDRIAEQQRQLMILKAELDHSASTQPAQSPVDDLDREEIKGGSGAIHAVLATVRKVAPASTTVLIRGESGTGKELLARTLHRNSPRRDGPMISVHCAALSEGLLESELFGHAKGAFTGAHQDKIGRFESATGGTLFLDEIGDISPETQVKLLRVLQERCFEPVGSSRTVHVDVRIITATNRNLEQLMAEGRFREDLYYRLNVIRIDLPPLRERPEDLVELVFHFIARSAERTGKEIRRIEPEALAVLERHSWPGNIRELENTIERAVVLSEGTSITLRDLPPELLSPDGRPAVAAVAASSGTRLQTPAAPGLRQAKREAERDMLISALRATNGNKAEAARSLGLPRSTFYSKLKKHQLA